MSAWDDKSREVLLTCDRNGVIRTLDRRAERLLCVNAGVRLRELAAPGVEEKLDRLLEKARTQPVDDWEVALICAGRPSTFVFSARGAEDGLIELFGVRLPERYGQTVEQLTDSINEVVELNREVTRQKREIERQKHDLERAYRELDESNRGVLALHKEIADKSDTIQRSADVKSRLLANVSHELRTPLHTIRGLAGLLLDGVDGHLNEEQRKQINFIRHASEELTQMVSDLLDLSKAESGKVMVRPERFTVPELFAALRGQMRPLLDPKRDVELVFEDPEEPMAMESDHGKIAQILRNLVSNGTWRARVTTR